MEICLVKDPAAAVEERHGSDARQDFVVSTTIPPKGKRSSTVAYGCAGYNRSLLEQHAADEICLEDTKITWATTTPNHSPNPITFSHVGVL